MESMIETLESRRFLSGAGGIVGEYHGVLRFGDLPAGVIRGVGAKEAGDFTTRVILILNTLNKNGTVTGTLKAGKLGNFDVAGSARRGRLALVLNDSDSTTHTLAASTATFSAPNRNDGKLRGSFVEEINSTLVTGQMRLRFLKDLATTTTTTTTTTTSSSSSAASGTSSTTQTAFQGSTPDISGTNAMGFTGSLDISGTDPMGSSGSLDISGTSSTALQQGSLDISGTTPGGVTGAPDISGSNSNNG